MSRKRSIVKMLLAFLLFFAAAVLMCYPFISNYVFERRTDSVVYAVEKRGVEKNYKEKEAVLKQVREYNESIFRGHIRLQDPFVEKPNKDETREYHSLLNINSYGVMGILEIPSIRVKLPIYHGTTEAVLEKGIGHLESSSLPIGGKSTHTVLTGHTGLNHAKLFTDLTEMEEGNLFFLKVLGENLVYQVDQIKVVRPTELSELCVEEGKDYCTLVTCTPYGVNSHRLLVRGVRIDDWNVAANSEEFRGKSAKSKWMAEYERAVFFSLTVFVFCFGIVSFYRRFSRRWKG